MRTEAEREAIFAARATAEQRAKLLEDTIKVVKAMRAPGSRGDVLAEVVEAKVERDAYLARLQALSDAAEHDYEAADNAAHAIEHEETRCTCDAFKGAA